MPDDAKKPKPAKQSKRDDRVLQWREMGDLSGENGHQHDLVDKNIEALNKEFCVVVESNGVAILSQYTDKTVTPPRRCMRRLSPQQFRFLYGNKFVSIGQKVITLGQYWSEHPMRRQYRFMKFDPSTTQTEPGVLNTWEGFDIEPKPGNWNLFRQHLQDVGAAGDPEIFSFLMKWLALLVQYPHISPGVAIVWRGGQGVGKGFMARTIGRLVGRHYVHLVSPHQLTGRFNDHLREALVVFADEAFWAGDKTTEGALKALITEPAGMYERKFGSAEMSSNYIHLLVASNKDWVIPMGFDDRRFCVIDVPDVHQQDIPYFKRIVEQMEQREGYAAMLWDLKMWPVDPTDKLIVPVTFATLESSLKQKIETMEPRESWWFSKLESGTILRKSPDREWGDVDVDDLFDDYLDEMRRMNYQHPGGVKKLTLFLHRAAPPTLHQRYPRRRPGGQSRRAVWAMPTLAECRAHFAKLLHHPTLFDLYTLDDTDD